MDFGHPMFERGGDAFDDHFPKKGLSKYGLFRSRKLGYTEKSKTRLVLEWLPPAWGKPSILRKKR
jgi:hypothetical protein